MMLSGTMEALVRSRIEDALANNRDPTSAAIAAFMEINANLTPNAQNILRSVSRVEIHRGTENRYRVVLQNEDDISMLDLTHKELAEGPKRFNEQFLQHFSRLPQWSKGEWPSFVETLLHHEHATTMEGREDINEEELAVEGFVERAQKWRITRDLHLCVRDEDKVWWEEDTRKILVRGDRVERYLKTSGRDVTLERFAYLLKERGIVIQTSFQKKVPPGAVGGKPQNLRFWRLDPQALEMSEADIMPAVNHELPPEPSIGASEGAG